MVELAPRDAAILSSINDFAVFLCQIKWHCGVNYSNLTAFSQYTKSVTGRGIGRGFMKVAICKLLLVINLFPFAALAQTSVDTQIKRVEQGLLPPVLIKGIPRGQ